MSDSLLDELRESVVGKIAEVKTLVDQGREDYARLNAKFEEINLDDVKSLVAGKEGFKQAEEKVIQQEEKLADLKKEVDELLRRAAAGGQSQGKGSLGQQLIKSESYQCDPERFSFTYDGGLYQKDITQAAASAGSVMPYDRVMQQPLMPRLTIRDLLPSLPYDKKSIEIAVEKLYTNSAAEVDEGAVKPKSSLTFEPKLVNMSKIAHYFQVSDETLADAPFLGAYIENRGIVGLKIKEEEALLKGPGTGTKIHGLVPQATALAPIAGDKQIDTLRKAINQVYKAEMYATGIVLHPDDLTAIDLLKTTDGAYLMSNPVSGGVSRVWGLPVVQTTAMTAGQHLTGDFLQCGYILDRMQVLVKRSTENIDNFIKNMVTILIEERLALAVDRPAGLISGALKAA